MESQVVTLTLPVQEVDAILGGLGELPAKVSYGLINKIKLQAESQLQATAAQQPEVLNETKAPEADSPTAG